MVFPEVTYGCESWTINKAEHQRIDVFEIVLEKILEDPFNLKIKPINPKGNQPWIYIGKTDAESEAGASIPWSPDMKSQVIGKVLLLGKINGKGEEDGRGWDG